MEIQAELQKLYLFIVLGILNNFLFEISQAIARKPLIV